MVSMLITLSMLAAHPGPFGEAGFTSLNLGGHGRPLGLAAAGGAVGAAQHQQAHVALGELGVGRCFGDSQPGVGCGQGAEVGGYPLLDQGRDQLGNEVLGQGDGEAVHSESEEGLSGQAVLLALGVHLNHEALAAALQRQLVGVVGEVKLREAHLHPAQPALALPRLGKAGGLAAGVGGALGGAERHVGPQGIGLALGVETEAVAQHGQHRALGAAQQRGLEVEQIALLQALGQGYRFLALQGRGDGGEQGSGHGSSERVGEVWKAARLGGLRHGRQFVGVGGGPGGVALRIGFLC
jgi:hypothetical protein